MGLAGGPGLFWFAPRVRKSRQQSSSQKATKSHLPAGLKTCKDLSLGGCVLTTLGDGEDLTGNDHAAEAHAIFGHLTRGRREDGDQPAHAVPQDELWHVLQVPARAHCHVPPPLLAWYLSSVVVIPPEPFDELRPHSWCAGQVQEFKGQQFPTFCTPRSAKGVREESCPRAVSGVSERNHKGQRGNAHNEQSAVVLLHTRPPEPF